MTHGSLFAGIGGFDLGFERAGIRTLWQVEIDPFCRRVLEKHWPDVQRFADIRECRQLPAVDIISGGFPCQPFSHAGRRGGSSDNRHLWPEMLRVVSCVRPRYIVAENVRGFISLDAGRYLDQVYADLATEGYETFPPLVLPASAFGAPHRRDRCWILAHRGHDGWSAEQREQQEEWAEGVDRSGAEDVAYADSTRPQGRNGKELPECSGELSAWKGGTLCHSTGTRLSHRAEFTMGKPAAVAEFERPDWWETEPPVGRVAHGIPGRVDRLRSLGNSIVPQIAEWIGRRILEAERRKS